LNRTVEQVIENPNSNEEHLNMRIGKAFVTSALALSLVASPALAGAEKLAVSAAAAAQDDDDGFGSEGVIIGIGALAAIGVGIAIALDDDDDDPVSP
jgi:hypothetical protein